MSRMWSYTRRRTPHGPLRTCDNAGVTIRYAVLDDLPALELLAALDSSTLPPGPLLVAEVMGELWSALPLLDGEAIADPFRPTAELRELLRKRASQLRWTQPPDSALTLEPLLSPVRV